MAIKGKSRKRSRARGPALPPRPSVGARRTPLPFRRDVKRAVVIVLAVLAFLGGLRVWQNVDRAHDLKVYDRTLTEAQAAFIALLQPQANGSSVFDQNLTAFTQGAIGGKAMIALADQWEKDFRGAEAKVKSLKAPNPVANDAQVLMAQGIDGYVGVVRLFNLAGQFKVIAEGTKDAKQKAALNEKIQVLLQHAGEWRKDRADVIYVRGSTKLRDLNVEYGLESRQPANNSGTQG